MAFYGIDSWNQKLSCLDYWYSRIETMLTKIPSLRPPKKFLKNDEASFL
jgi:hypothetical protein